MGTLSSTTSGSIDVFQPGVTIDFFVHPSPPWRIGQTITLRAYVTMDGAPSPGHPVTFYFAIGTTVIWSGTATTDHNGEASLTMSMPAGAGCRIGSFYATEDIYGTRSSTIEGAVNRRTRFTNVSIPTRVRTKGSFTVSGVLEVETEPDRWAGYGGKPVRIRIPEINVDETVTTASDGSFSRTYTAPDTPTRLTVIFEFAGEPSTR